MNSFCMIICCRLTNTKTLAKKSADYSPPLFGRPATCIQSLTQLQHLLTAGSASLQSSASHALTGRLFIIFICFFCQSTCGSSDLELKVCQEGGGGEELDHKSRFVRTGKLYGQNSLQ